MRNFPGPIPTSVPDSAPLLPFSPLPWPLLPAAVAAGAAAAAADVGVSGLSVGVASDGAGVGGVVGEAAAGGGVSVVVGGFSSSCRRGIVLEKDRGNCDVELRKGRSCRKDQTSGLATLWQLDMAADLGCEGIVYCVLCFIRGLKVQKCSNIDNELNEFDVAGGPKRQIIQSTFLIGANPRIAGWKDPTHPTLIFGGFLQLGNFRACSVI